MLGQAVVAVTTMLAGRFCPPYMVDRFEILRSVQKLKSKLGTFPELGKVESDPTATDLPAPALSTAGRSGFPQTETCSKQLKLMSKHQQLEIQVQDFKLLAA